MGRGGGTESRVVRCRIFPHLAEVFAGCFPKGAWSWWLLPACFGFLRKHWERGKTSKKEMLE